MSPFSLERVANMAIGTLSLATSTALTPAKDRKERGLSQSTENVILLVGAVAIAIIVIATVRGYVESNLKLTPPQ